MPISKLWAPQFPTHQINALPPPLLGGMFAVEQIQPYQRTDDIPHRHSFSEIMYITAGEGRHVVDFGAYSLEPQQVFVVAQGQVHYWEEVTTLEGVQILFKEEFLRWSDGVPQPISELSAHGAPALKPTGEQTRRVERLLAAIGDEYAAPSASQPVVLRALLTALLVECGRMSALSSRSFRSRVVRGFIEVATQRVSATTSVSSCASSLGVTPGHLHSMVVAETGRTPGQFSRGSLTREAQRLLAGSELTSAQIAGALGFSSASYFSRFFQREVGATPSLYREQHRNGLDRPR